MLPPETKRVHLSVSTLSSQSLGFNKQSALTGSPQKKIGPKYWIEYKNPSNYMDLIIRPIKVYRKPLGMIGKLLGISNLCAPTWGIPGRGLFCSIKCPLEPKLMHYSKLVCFTKTILDGSKPYRCGSKS